MAKVTYGALVSGVRGKIGGLVFRSGKTGATVSASPTVARTTSRNRELARYVITTAARKWKSLSQGDRAAWTTYATPSAAPGEVYKPAPAMGRAAFFRWYTAALWCGQTPSYFWPRSAPFDFSAFAFIFHDNTIHSHMYAVTSATAAAPLCALWVASRPNNYTVPTRPVWQLVTSPLLGDSQAWTLHPTVYPGGYGLALDSYLTARVSGWAVNKEWIYRMRIFAGDQSIAPVDCGLYDSGVLYP